MKRRSQEPALLQTVCSAAEMLTDTVETQRPRATVSGSQARKRLLLTLNHQLMLNITVSKESHYIFNPWAKRFVSLIVQLPPEFFFFKREYMAKSEITEMKQTSLPSGFLPCPEINPTRHGD